MKKKKPHDHVLYQNDRYDNGWFDLVLTNSHSEQTSYLEKRREITIHTLNGKS